LRSPSKQSLERSRSESKSEDRSESKSEDRSESKSEDRSESKSNEKSKDRSESKSENTYTVDIARLSYSTEKELLLEQSNIYTIVRDTFIKNNVVFFGGYANILYSRYMPKHQRRLIQKIPDFDVLSEDPRIVCEDVVSELLLRNYKKVKYVRKNKKEDTRTKR
jgi:hypothetical protein